MKKSRIILFLITNPFLAGTVFSQDTVYIHNGPPVSVHITEINVAEIKYTRNTNPDGPLYILTKETIDSVKFKNGTREVFLKSVSGQTTYTLPSKSLLILKGDNFYFGNEYFKSNKLPDFIEKNADRLVPEMLILAKKQRTNYKLFKAFQISSIPCFIVGGIGLILGGAMFILSGIAQSSTQSNLFVDTWVGTSAVITGMGLGFAITSVINRILQKNRIKKSVRLYNSGRF